MIRIFKAALPYGIKYEIVFLSIFCEIFAAIVVHLIRT